MSDSEGYPNVSEQEPLRSVEDYAVLTLPDLRDLAVDRGLRGISKLNKGSLIKLLVKESARDDQEEAEAERPKRRPRRPSRFNEDSAMAGSLDRDPESGDLASEGEHQEENGVSVEEDVVDDVLDDATPAPEVRRPERRVAPRRESLDQAYPASARPAPVARHKRSMSSESRPVTLSSKRKVPRDEVPGVPPAIRSASDQFGAGVSGVGSPAQHPAQPSLLISPDQLDLLARELFARANANAVPTLDRATLDRFAPLNPERNPALLDQIRQQPIVSCAVAAHNALGDIGRVSVQLGGLLQGEGLRSARTLCEDILKIAEENRGILNYACTTDAKTASFIVPASSVWMKDNQPSIKRAEKLVKAMSSAATPPAAFPRGGSSATQQETRACNYCRIVGHIERYCRTKQRDEAHGTSNSGRGGSGGTHRGGRGGGAGASGGTGTS